MRNFSSSLFGILLFVLLFTSEAYSQKIFNLKKVLRFQQRLNEQQVEDSINSVKAKLNNLDKKNGLVVDSLRLELLNKLALWNVKKSKDSSFYYAEYALSKAKSLRLVNVTAVSLYNLGSLYEYYNDFTSAEKLYLEWMQIRKSQNDDEYRWALKELREFYAKTGQEAKLAKIEEEWLMVLDRQLKQGHISPWFGWEDASPEENYQHSIEPGLNYLISMKYYFIAEKSFIHMIKNCPDCVEEWRTADNIYFKAERSMLRLKDTATLAVWYEHWYNALEKYGSGKQNSLQIFNDISQEYTSGYFKYDQYFDKFYPLMMGYTHKVGGDTAVHDLLKNSSRRYVSSLSIRIKLNLFLLESCPKVKDNETMEKTYKQTDNLITNYLKNGFSKNDLYTLLLASKNRSEDNLYKKWCDKKIKSLK